MKMYFLPKSLYLRTIRLRNKHRSSHLLSRYRRDTYIRSYVIRTRLRATRMRCRDVRVGH